MNRREAIRRLTSALGVLNFAPPQATGQTRSPYSVAGSGPTVLAFNRAPKGYFEALSQRYRVVVLDYPPQDPSQTFIDSFTAERVCADILAVADAVGADRFAWFGFSWGAVVGLQLVNRTNRLTALALGGWPPLGGQYRETLAFTEAEATQGRFTPYATFYQSIRSWRERDEVAKITCPRLIFVGDKDQFVAGGHQIRHAGLIVEHRRELEQLGWAVRLIEGFGHELGGRPDVVIPLVREFLDPLMLRG